MRQDLNLRPLRPEFLSRHYDKTREKSFSNF